METRVLTPPTRPPGRIHRAGFTLVEVLVALVILSIAVLGVQALITQRMIAQVGGDDREAVAIQLAMDRIELVQIDPVYTAIESRYAGTEANLLGYPNFTRRTDVARTNTYNSTTKLYTDYKTITVTMTHPNLRAPVARTTVVAAP